MSDTIRVEGLDVFQASVVEHGGTRYVLAQDPATLEKFLLVKGDASGFAGETHQMGGTLRCPLTPENTAALRTRLSWLNTAPLGMATSAGFGDRLGIATPGHVLSVQGTGVAPIFSQQSVRENSRTGRTPQQVNDDAMWGVFQAGWREPWGADADHLKTPDDVDAFVAAGYSFFTVDPSEHVDNDADTDTEATLREKVAALPWKALDSSADDLASRFVGQEFDLGTLKLVFDEATVLRAATKYGRAVAYVAKMFQYLKLRLSDRPCDFEVSVDETETPTSIHEHFYVALEMQRLGVSWVSLAPRFVGRFEKGVDFIGDLDALDANLAGHAAVLRHIGGYKLSLHSGSDKFTVYPLAVRHAGGAVHLKTAGTSYLEALRVWAEVDPAMFRVILDFARARYPEDRATYHVSAQLSKVPAGHDLPDA
ncbi:MAG: tagaturonate epimerase family protein, partial [Anaerolineae bacterium]|nr:tagaturonate epimerase family protein [Anaerolineae bacterium]